MARISLIISYNGVVAIRNAIVKASVIGVVSQWRIAK